jgi:hypothetical protein
MMIKITFVTSLLLILISLIPYWTGIEAEKQLDHFNQAFYPTMNIQLVENDYQRGWFQSQAQSTLEIPKTLVFSSPHHRLVVRHEIEHGFLPIQPTLIHTQLQTDTHETTFLQINTVVQGNGESISTFEMKPLTFQEEKIHLQLGNLQGKVRTQFPSTLAQVELHNSQIQLTTEIYQLLMQNVILNTELQTTPSEFLQGVGYLTVEQSDFLPRKQPLTPLRFQKIHLVGHNDILSDYLTIAITLDLPYLGIGTDSYGPNWGKLELRHWHIPSLNALITNFMATRQQNLLPSSTYLTLFKLIPDGINLLQHHPEVAVTDLKINTAAGELQGTMQLQFESTQFNYFTLLNPIELFNRLQVQANIHLPRSLLATITNWAEMNFPLPQEQGIRWDKLITLEPNADYFSVQLQLEKGVFQVNGKHLSINYYGSRK